MSNEVLKKVGTPQICFADHAGDFSPTNDLQVGTPTEVQMSFVGVADTEARQSDKVDLGATRASTYEMMASLEFATAPTVGDSVDFYWAPSSSSVSGTANPGGVDGVDSDYTGYNSDMTSASKQLDYMGSAILVTGVTPVVQVSYCGVFSPSNRYGTLVARNVSGSDIHSDDVECHIVLNPIVDEVQGA